MLRQIGKYKVEKELGQGGFGKVYLGFDPDVGQPVAIKKLLAQGDADLLKRFQLEIRTTASLRHKNIVTIYASGEDDGDPYLVMEFLEGQTLKSLIQERKPLTLLEKVRIISQVAEGLGYANSKGVVHRDVKPENIMLLPDETVKIMDFGIALGPNRNTAVTQTGGIIGTPPYFAPEQLQGYKASEQTDIFSFGDVCYELLAGVHPFEKYKGDWKSLQIAIMSYVPRSIGELVPGCPEALESLVHRALTKEPEFRYQKFEEIQLDAGAILVDLKHEGAAAILREVPSLTATGNLPLALSKINQAYQLDPGNREVRRLREEINQQIQKEQIQTRVAKVLSEASKFMSDRRYAEAVECLEFGARLDTTNAVLAARLEEAKSRQVGYDRANRLVSEARYLHQKGQLPEAAERLQEALTGDPDHPDARRLRHRLHEELERRKLDDRRQQALRAAQEHRAARRFAEALAILDAAEADFPEGAGIAELRTAIQQDQAEEERRLRAERFHLAAAKTRSTIEAGDLARARSMVDRLVASFGADADSADALRDLRQSLDAAVRAAEIAESQHKARALLKDNSFREAVDLLAEALRKFPGDADLERLHKSAGDLYQAHQRAEAVATVLKEAAARRDRGDVQGALDTVSRARQSLGDEAALADLAGHLAIELEQKRYSAALAGLLKDGRELMAAGSYAAAAHRLEGAREFSGEAEVRALLASARTAAAVEEERRLVEELLAAAPQLPAPEALSSVERGLARYPENSALQQCAEGLRAQVKRELRRAAMERRRIQIGLEIGERQWDRAEALLAKARAEFPGAAEFDQLAAQIQSGHYEDGWLQVEKRVHQHLLDNSLPLAEKNLDDRATRTVYAEDPRWKALAEQVAQRRKYEDALQDAEGKLNAGKLSEAENLLTDVINRGAIDKRAQQLHIAVKGKRSEAQRQEEIARIAAEIRELLQRGDQAKAAGDLAAARSRYPGESAWDVLQSGLDFAAAQDKVRRVIASGDARQAAAELSAARARFPGQAVWDTLQSELAVRQAEEQRQREVAAATESIRGSLQQSRDTSQALAELDAAQKKYPGEPIWKTLRGEIEKRREFLDGRNEHAKRVAQSLERDDLAAAESQLAVARGQYPDEEFWGPFQAMAAIRGCRKRGDLRGANKALAEACTRYPREGIWATLQAEIDARQSEIERQAAIAAAADEIRALLDSGVREARELTQIWDVVRDAAGRLDQARTRYPGEALWTTLNSEIAARQTGITSNFAASVGACASLESLDGMAKQLAAARTRHSGEPSWKTLQAEIDARRQALERAAAAQLEAGIRERLQQGDLPAALAQLQTARTRYPGVPAWDELQARLKRQQDLDALEKSVREQLAALPVNEILRRWEAFQKAEGLLSDARAKYPGEERVAALQREAANRRVEWQRQVAQLNLDESAAPQVHTLRSEEPGEALWTKLENRMAAASAAKSIRQHIAEGDIEQAAAHLKAARASYPEEAAWPELAAGIASRRAEIDEAFRRAGNLLTGGRPQDALTALDKCPRGARRDELTARAGQAIEEQRLREARDRGRDQLLAIEGQIAAETRKRKRSDLDRQAQIVAAAHPQDREIAAIAARIHAVLEAPAAAEPAPSRPLPWKPIGMGIAAAALAGALFLWLHNKKTPEPPASPSVATVPFEIRTEPPGATLHIGDRSCYTNCSLDLKPGEYQLDAQLRGYQPIRQTVVVSASSPLVNLKLDPVPPPATEKAGGSPPIADAHIELTGAPANVELRLDGKPLGGARTVKPGEHTVGVSPGLLQAGAQPAVRSLSQRFDPGQTVQLVWKPEPAAPPVAPPPVAPPPSGSAPAHVTIPAPTPEEQDWAKVQNAGNAQQLRDFLKKYPGSTHAGEAQSSLDRIVWSGTRADNLSSLRAYMQEFPNGAHRRDALSQMDELTWKSVDRNDPAALRKFQSDNPNNPHKADAQSILDQLEKTAREGEKSKQAKAESERGVRAALELFNTALRNKSKRELTAVWPTVPSTTRDSFTTNTQNGPIQLDSPGNIIVTGDTATLSVNLVQKERPAQPVKVTLQKAANGWIITSLSR